MQGSQTWFKNTFSNNVPDAGMYNTLEFETLLHLPDLGASNGWLDAWEVRHNVTFRDVYVVEKLCTLGLQVTRQL